MSTSSLSEEMKRHAMLAVGAINDKNSEIANVLESGSLSRSEQSWGSLAGTCHDECHAWSKEIKMISGQTS